MRSPFLRVIKRLKFGAGMLPLERRFQKKIRKVRVLGQQRTVQIGSKSQSIARTFGAVLAIIPSSGDNPRKWLGFGTEVSSTAMILKSDQQTIFPVRDDIADAASGMRSGMSSFNVEDSDPGQFRSIGRDISITHQLVAAADREEDGTPIDGLPDQRAGSSR
jgi:hypothetical protein